MTAYIEGSKRYCDSRQLCDLGFMRAPPGYAAGPSVPK